MIDHALARAEQLLMDKKALFLGFIALMLFLFVFNAFPSLYGDEYGSLFDAFHLAGNIHAIGYFSQLRFWNFLWQEDWFLRLLSLLWFGAGLYWLIRWLETEKIPGSTRVLLVWLVTLNPFLWIYGFQVRFYAMFFATSILFVWRFRTWQTLSSGRNLFLLLISVVLLLVSHLFGLLVIGATLLNSIWEKLPSRKKWWLVAALALGTTLLFYPPIRLVLVQLVFRASNPYAEIPVGEAGRGLSIGMLAKVPLTFYFFTIGERVYPLWWWVTVPAMMVIGIAFLLGLWRLRKHPALGSLSVFMLFNIPLLYLVLDPLAPPSLQGAAPRYLIFVVPYFLYLAALGAETWKPLIPALVLVSLVGLYYVAVPRWSYGATDLANWRSLMAQAVSAPEETCIIADGRAYSPVTRYAPVGTKITGQAADCVGFARIILITNYHRLSHVRSFDDIAPGLFLDYGLVSNTTKFPAQVTVYDKNMEASSAIFPSRLDLPEQDLYFPISIPERDWLVQGFARMDESTSHIQVPISIVASDQAWMLTNYRSETGVSRGTPVFRVQYTIMPGNEVHEMVLRSGMETAAWNGDCDVCVPMYEWNKKLHLLGSSSYPGAYSQYSAHIWGIPVADILPAEVLTSIEVTYLLNNGVGYLYGIFPESE